MIRLVVALDAEAGPLLEHYRLRRDREARGFALYRSAAAGREMALIVAGVGCTAAAAATAYLAGVCAPDRRRRPAVWINVGVGGHARRGLGEACLAHRVSAADGRCWYPPLVIEPPCASVEVISVDRPETAYPDDAIYDMEAAGFFPTANRFDNAELIQVLKIVSDNRAEPADRPGLDAARLRGLIRDRLDLLDAVIERTVALVGELDGNLIGPEDPQYKTCTRLFRFSEHERRRLDELLRRWRCLRPEQALRPERFASGKALLAYLDQATSW